MIKIKIIILVLKSKELDFSQIGFIWVYIQLKSFLRNSKLKTQAFRLVHKYHAWASLDHNSHQDYIHWLPLMVLQQYTKNQLI